MMVFSFICVPVVLSVNHPIKEYPGLLAAGGVHNFSPLAIFIKLIWFKFFF